MGNKGVCRECIRNVEKYKKGKLTLEVWNHVMKKELQRILIMYYFQYLDYAAPICLGHNKNCEFYKLLPYLQNIFYNYDYGEVRDVSIVFGNFIIKIS